MAAVYALVGERLNHLARAVTAPAASPAADSLYPVSDWQILLGGFPGKPLRLGSAAADPKITVDLQMLANGGFEAGALTSWSTTGTVATTTSNPRTGTHCATITTGGTLYQEIYCRSGEKIHVEVYIRQVTNGSGTGTVTVECRETGKFYNGSAWAASGNIGTNTTSTYTAASADIVTEGLDVTLSPLITIRVTVTCTGGGSNTLVDDTAVWPWTDFCSLHGHKYVDPRLVPTFRSSTDNFSGSDTVEATLTIAQPSFWTRLAAPVGRRYWRFQMTGTPRAAPYLDRLIIGQSYSLPVLPRAAWLAPWEFAAHRAQVRNETFRGGVHTAALSAQDQTDLTLPFMFRTESDFQTLYRELRTRSEGGVFPAVLVPDGAQPRVLYGLLGDVLPFRRVHTDGTTRADYETAISFRELPTLQAGL